MKSESESSDHQLGPRCYFELEKHVPYLMNRVGFQIADAFEARLGAEGLTLPMWRVLVVLRSGMVRRISDLAEPTSLEPSTLSRLVKAMERTALLKRSRSAEDERSINVSITARGHRAVETMIPIALALENELLGGLKKDEIATFRNLLARLNTIKCAGLEQRVTNANEL